MIKKLAGVLLLATAATAQAQVAQERVDLSVIQRIRDEGLNHSQIEDLTGYLTDVIGPRVTGSPQMKTANQWTADKFRAWGLQNVVIEPWGEFGRGWERVNFAGRILTPYIQPLDAMPVAWTGSTKGTVIGNVVLFENVSDLAGLAKYRGQLKGAILLRQGPPSPGPEFAERMRRVPADSLLAPRPETAPDAQRRPGGPNADAFRARMALMAAVDSFFRAEGVAAVLQPSAWQYSVLLVQGNNAARAANAPIPVPTVVISLEQAGQIERNLKRGVPVKVELNVQNRFFNEDTKAYNTLAELTGSDKAEEYVMLGGHLDSWQGGTGATDNAAGSAVMMEAMRILKTLDLKPRRTIRVALWSGEEQGLLGSRGWVENHKELWSKISAYVNVDNGTGKLRGIWDQGNELAIPVFEQILWPFRDLGVVAVRHGNTGGTDHLSFAAQGIPGFNFIQDPIEYNFRTHHSNVDTYERLLIDDLKQAAVVVASTVYTLAMRDEMMPRKPVTTSTN